MFNINTILNNLIRLKKYIFLIITFLKLSKSIDNKYLNIIKIFYYYKDINESYLLIYFFNIIIK